VRNAPTRLMKELDYGKGYRYGHVFEGGFAPQEYLPEPLRQRRFYRPTDRGYEKTIGERILYWDNLRKSLASEEGEKP
jgi:putative ATPase